MSMQVVQADATRPESDGKAYVDFVKRYPFTYADMVSKVYAVPVPAGVAILGVRLLVTTAFAGGGAEDLKVGDSDNDAGYIPLTAITAAQYQFVNSMADAVAGAFAAGKYYSASSRILVTAASTGALTAGAAVLEILYAGYGQGPAREQISNLS